MIFISILILIVALALPSFKKNLSPILFCRISSIIFIYAGTLSFNVLYFQSIGSGIGIYSGLFHVTIISQLLEVFLLIIGSLILVAWPLLLTNNQTEERDVTMIGYGEVKELNKNASEYSLVVLFSTLGASLLVSSADLVSMYLSIELQSFGLYILSTLYRDSESATSAGLKYFLLGGLSSCLILLGAGLIYAFTGLTNFESIYSLSSVSDSYNIIQGLSLGLIIIIVGFLFKIAAAPLHNWSPDVYDDSPTIVTIWLTIMPKISILILFLELHTQIGFIGGLNSLTISSMGYAEFLNYITSQVSSTGLINITEVNNGLSLYPLKTTINIVTDVVGENNLYALKTLLLISSLLSLIVGTVVGLAQTRIKRLLAYSTISHIGFMLLALAINTEQSIDSLIFYMIQYTITNLNIFLIIIGLSYIINHSVRENRASANKTVNYTENKTSLFTDIKYISEFKGQFFSNPLLSLSLTICLFSMAGTPPLIGFFSKQFVLYSAMQSGYYFMAIVAIIVSVVSASYYLKVIKVLHTETEELLSISSVNQTSLSEVTLNSKDSSSISYQHDAYELNADKEIYKSNSLLTNFHSFLISSLTLSILLFVIKPSLILNSTQLLSLSLFNF